MPTLPAKLCAAPLHEAELLAYLQQCRVPDDCGFAADMVVCFEGVDEATHTTATAQRARGYAF